MAGLGSRDPSALVAVSEVVKYLAWLGQQFTEQTDIRDQLRCAGKVMLEHEHSLISLLLNGSEQLQGLVDMPGVSVVGTMDINQREGALSFSVDGWQAADIVALLGDRGVRIHARSNDMYSGNILRPLGLDSVSRISFAHYNTKDEVTFFLEQLLEILKQ